MEQLDVFITLIKNNWFFSTLIILSIIIVISGILKGLNLGMKIVFSLLILGMIGVVGFALFTLLS